MNSSKETILLEEYKICDSQVSRIDTLIWRTAVIIGWGLLVFRDAILKFY